MSYISRQVDGQQQFDLYEFEDRGQVDVAQPGRIAPAGVAGAQEEVRCDAR